MSPCAELPLAAQLPEALLLLDELRLCHRGSGSDLELRPDFGS